MKRIGVAIIGFGTVGTATVRILSSNAKLIESRAGVSIYAPVVCRRSTPRNLSPENRFVSDWREAIRDPEAQIIVETVGGIDVARSVIEAALNAGKPVVTANKALLSVYGDELAALAHKNNVPLRFEAAVAGGIPVIRALAEGAVGDDLLSVYGILNGTSNFILSRMESAGAEFSSALREAQEAGYAEQDPSRDIDGQDTQDKLAILARLAFGTPVEPRCIRTAGIRNIRAVDMHYAKRLDSTIRLVGSATRDHDGIDVSVGPWLVGRDSMLGKVEGAHNAVFLHGRNLGKQVFYGEGAGGAPTGAAVVSDIVQIARELSRGTLRFSAISGFGNTEDKFIAAAPGPSSWYLRLTVKDRPGILARVADIIAAEHMNIDSVIQEPHMDKADLSFVITVEPVGETNISRAVTAINKLEFMKEHVLLMKID